MINAGHCSACGTAVWRTAVAQREQGDTKAGEVFLLWPAPDSLYARVAVSAGVVAGIAYCPSCAPVIGTPGPDDLGPIIAYETARDRYADWYAERRGAFYRAWLRDHLAYDDGMIEKAMRTWEQDRVA